MKYWADLYKVAEYAMCLEATDAICNLLSKNEINYIKISVKKDIINKVIMCGYANIQFSVNEKMFNYKFLISWSEKKFEPIGYWITVVKEGYINSKDSNFLTELYQFNKDINSSWEHLSKWIVYNTDYEELIIDKNSNVRELVLGSSFNKNLKYVQLDLLLNEDSFKDKVKKI